MIKSQKKLVKRFTKITKKLDAFAKMAILNECSVGEVFRKKSVAAGSKGWLLTRVCDETVHDLEPGVTSLYLGGRQLDGT